MALRTIDAAVVQKNSLRVDELLSKLVSLEEQLASLKLQRKVRSSSPHHHQRSRSRSKSRRRYNPQGRYCFYHFRFGKKCLPGKCVQPCSFNEPGNEYQHRRLDPPLDKNEGECQASQYKLYAANGTEIPTYGLKILTLDLGLRRPFQWPFIIAKVERGIIGADFLQKFQLLIDLHNRKLIDGVTNLSIKGEVATIQENNDLSTVNRASKYFNLLKLYPDLTKPNLVNRVVKHEIPIAEEDKEKTAITTPFGLYEFNTMSFGLRNAPSTFQRFITEVLYGLDFVFPYLDDVLVASSTEEEHSEHLKMVFERFQQYGLRINVSKSVMGAAQIEYLGFLITAEGSRPLPEKVQAIFNYKLPETIHDLRTFLGMINFYRRYLKDAAKTQAPLHELLKGAKRKTAEKCIGLMTPGEASKNAKLTLPKLLFYHFKIWTTPITLHRCIRFCCGRSTPAIRKRRWKPIAFTQRS
ncbi:hypothetical protein TNCV_789991 [Trichonephila clavipes]|nr:hypothetical protein TNCV_789991 [Trichonephila clavipes]